MVINVVNGAELREVHIPRNKRLSMKTIANQFMHTVMGCRKFLME
jgi:hypothetical protein